MTPASHLVGGNHRGLVVDNEDPLKYGRVRVRVHGFFDGVDADDLPWAVPAYPLMAGAGSGYGWFGIPAEGTEVWCFFEAGDYNQPVYFAEAPDGIRGHPTVGDTNYPDRRGFRTKSGQSVYVDDEDKKIVIQHSSGTIIRIDQSGDIVVSAQNITVTGQQITISGSQIDLNP